jgi:hypothetical protein
MDCYEPADALDIYFAYKNGEYDDHEDSEFNWDDWRSNFDLSDDYWFYDADLTVVFPHAVFADNVDWMCDENEVCYYFDASSYTVCIRGDECYSPEEALDNYFAYINGEYDDHEEYDIFSEIIESMYMQMYEEFELQEISVGSAEEWEAMFYPVFEEKWDELVAVTSSDEVNLEWQPTWDLVWQPIWDDLYDQFYSDEYEMTEDETDFNWDDWRSNFSIYEGWFYDADMSGLFPYPMFEDNVDWMCDEEEVCFFFNSNEYQVCIRGDECYSPEDALDLYFAHKNGEYDDHEEYDECWETHNERDGETSEERCYALEGCIYDSEYDHCYSEWQEWDDHEFNWDDWRSNFDTTYDGWF